MIRANNRQLKILRFFGIHADSVVSTETASRDIANLLADEQNKKQWDKYVYLTQDFDSASPELKAFEPATLSEITLPSDWSATKAERHYREELAAKVLETTPLYDGPPPTVVFNDHVFLFTGKFEFGTREACKRAVQKRGGFVPDPEYVSHVVDYLVVGNEGSDRWKRNTYGAKIETAVVERHIHGKPEIITEAHWRSSL